MITVCGCVKTWIMLSFVRRGEVRSPENSLLCVFGQATPAPTVDDWIVRFRFDTSFYTHLKPNT